MDDLDLEKLKRSIEQSEVSGCVVAPSTYFTRVPDMFRKRTKYRFHYGYI